MSTTIPREGSIEELRSRLAGGVLDPRSAGYDEARQAWNLSFEHNPNIIVIPASASDVSAAVQYAAQTGLKVAIQSTGHGVAKVADGAMLILTKNLDEVAVDPENWTARIGGGAKWEKVLGPAVAAGLAPLLGSTPDVSAAGYTLGGGMGWLARKYGLSADHVRAIELVTADGAIRRASPDSETDLFWALRGGGAGSFGVVTAIAVDLVPASPMYAAHLFYPASMAREVGARYRDWVVNAPQELTSSIAMMNFPPVEDVPDPLRGRSFVIIRGAFLGDDEGGEALLSYWRDWRTPEVDMWGRMPFAEIAAVSSDPVDPLPGLASTEWLDVISDDAIDILAAAMFEQDGPSPLAMAEIRHAGGAVSRQPEHPNAYGNRARQHVLEVVGITMTPEDKTSLEAFVTRLQADLAPHLAGGAYLNFLEGEEKIRRSAEGFEPESWQRLREIKAQVDPTNLFDHGIAIR